MKAFDGNVDLCALEAGMSQPDCLGSACSLLLAVAPICLKPQELYRTVWYANSTSLPDLESPSKQEARVTSHFTEGFWEDSGAIT